MSEISKRELELPGSVLTKMLKIAEESKDVISLSVGEPDFSTPKPILNYAKKVLDRATHYSPSEGREEFREAIVKKLSKENKIYCSKENIIATCGSQEAYLLALSTLVDVAEEVIVPSPGYLGYLPTVEILSCFPVQLQLKEEDSFGIDFSKLQRIINKKTRIIVINTPSNPTGRVLTKKELEALADIVVEHDLMVISDEAYEKLVYDDAKHISFASLNGMFDYTITLQSFSKSFAMPGFRIGYAAGPEKVIKAMIKLHPYTTLTASTLSQMVAVYALKISNKHVEKMRKEYDRRRRFIWKRLNEIGLPTVKPKGAFYAFSNIKEYGLTSLEFSEHVLKHAKVAVIPGTEFGLYGEGYVRFSYATALPKIKQALERLEEEIKEMRRKVKRRREGKR